MVRGQLPGLRSRQDEKARHGFDHSAPAEIKEVLKIDADPVESWPGSTGQSSTRGRCSADRPVEPAMTPHFAPFGARYLRPILGHDSSALYFNRMQPHRSTSQPRPLNLRPC